MFTVEEIDAMASKMSAGYNDKYAESAAVKMLALKRLMQETGIKEVKILL